VSRDAPARVRRFAGVELTELSSDINNNSTTSRGCTYSVYSSHQTNSKLVPRQRALTLLVLMRLLFSIACLLRCGSALVRRSAPRQLPVTWSNPQGAVLTPIGDDIWLAERPFYPRLPGLQGTDVGCKAVVVRLPDDTLWVHAPVGLDGPLLEALAELGTVKHIVTPNSEHQKFAPAWLLAFPEAVGYACPGLLEKQWAAGASPGGWARSLVELLDEPDGVTSAAPPAEWAGAIELCWFRDRIPLDPLQRPFFNEVVFCHKPSRTLIVSDLWCNSMSRTRHVWPASAAQAADWPRLAGAWGSLRMLWR